MFSSTDPKQTEEKVTTSGDGEIPAFVTVYSTYGKLDVKPSIKSVSMAIVTDGEMTFLSIDVSKLERERKFTWLEGIAISEELDREIRANSSKAAVNEDKLTKLFIEKFKYYFQHINTINAKFALFDMGAFGLATVNQQALQKADTVGVYAGYYFKEGKSIPGVDASYSFSHFPEKEGGDQYLTDATMAGNMSRFFPHLIHPKRLAVASLPGIDKSKIATENIRQNDFMVAGRSVCLFTAKQDIPAKSLVGFSYGKSYWQQNQFCLFYKNGTPAAMVKYGENDQITLIRKM